VGTGVVGTGVGAGVATAPTASTASSKASNIAEIALDLSQRKARLLIAQPSNLAKRDQKIDRLLIIIEKGAILLDESGYGRICATQ